MADLQILIEVLGKNLAGGALGDVHQDLEQLEQKSLSTSQALVGVGGAMTAVGVAGAAMFGSAISAAGDFQATMSGVKAVMAPEDIDTFGAALEALALKLGKDTSFSAKEAAQGIGELTKAGISAADILGGAGAAALDLAAAGGIKVGDAAEIAANAMNAFNLQGSDLAHVADLISGTANASAIDVMDFKFALSQSGAVAAAAGVSMDELAVAIGLMGNAGIKGSDAGTSIKTMLTNLTPASKPAEAAFRQLGIITDELGNRFFDAEGQARPLSARFQVLKEGLDGLSDQDRTELLHKAFGTDAMRAAAVFAKAGAEGADAFAHSLQGLTAQATAAERLNNLQGAMEQLKGSFETLQITIGLKLLPTLQDLVGIATGILNGFLELPEPVQNTAVAIGLVVTAVGLIGGPLLMLAGLLPTLTAGFALMAPAIAAVAIPVVALTAAVALLAAAWVNDWGDMRTNLTAIW
ncbi:MAG TPA: phage tail tape measure protein, partial [Hyphomicrobiaceae bacterium]|nr:phage tail tape measure protein [Hyphomicrobiaceae bacterium]